MLQKRITTKHEVCEAKGNRESQGFHHSKCPELNPQRLLSARHCRGVPSDGSLLQGAVETHPEKHLLGVTQTQEQGSAWRCNLRQQHLAGTQTRHALTPQQGCNHGWLFLTSLIAHKAKGTARKQPAHASAASPVPSHCPQTMNFPETN